jgi:DNA-binding CsgD family transcriptional regulator
LTTTTRFAQLIIDTADALASADTSDEIWWSINRVAARIGAKAVNAGSFARSTQEIGWIRSSMDPLWLEEYADAGLFAVDPLLGDAMRGKAPPLYDVLGRDRSLQGAGDGNGAPVGKLRALHSGMASYDYNYMIAHSWFEGDAGLCLALGCREDPHDLFGPGTARAFSAVSAMMASRLVAPGDALHEGWAYGAGWQPLLPQERDVLACLANGLGPFAISERLAITEVEVVRRIHSAALKMRARTHDQALALAIARGQVEP